MKFASAITPIIFGACTFVAAAPSPQGPIETVGFTGCRSPGFENCLPLSGATLGLCQEIEAGVIASYFTSGAQNCVFYPIPGCPSSLEGPPRAPRESDLNPPVLVASYKCN